MIVILRTFSSIHFIQRNKFPVPKTRWTYSRHISDKADGTGSNRSQVRTGHRRIAIIFIKKDTVSTYMMDIAITQGTFFRSPENNGSSPIYRPVRTEQRLIMFHKCPYRLRQFYSFNSYVFHRMGWSSCNFNQVFKLRSFKHQLVYIFIRQRIIIQPAFLFIIVPFSRSIQFFKDILYHPVFRMDSHWTIILPATFQLQLSLFILACNTIMKITPIMTMHGMKVTTFRILPFFHSFRGCCQSRCTIKTNSCFIIIRITCHRPQISVYNKHIHNRIPFHSSPHDTILVLFPFQVQGNSARYYSFLTWIIPYY